MKKLLQPVTKPVDVKTGRQATKNANLKAYGYTSRGEREPTDQRRNTSGSTVRSIH